MVMFDLSRYLIPCEKIGIFSCLTCRLQIYVMPRAKFGIFSFVSLCDTLGKLWYLYLGFLTMPASYLILSAKFAILSLVDGTTSLEEIFSSDDECLAPTTSLATRGPLR